MDYAEMMKKKNNYSVILIASTIVIGILVTLFAIFPLYKSAKITTAESTQKSLELTELRNKKKILDGLKDKEDQLKKDAETVMAALPEKKDVGSLFIQVNALVSQSGGSVQSITGAAQGSTEQTGFTGIQKYSYNIPATFNNYSSFKAFINGSRDALRLLNVDDLSLTASDAGNLQGTIDLTTFARN